MVTPRTICNFGISQFKPNVTIAQNPEISVNTTAIDIKNECNNVNILEDLKNWHHSPRFANKSQAYIIISACISPRFGPAAAL